MKYLIISITVLIISTVIFSACSAPKSSLSEYTSTLEKDVSFNEDIIPIMKKSCAPCHFEDGKAEHLYEYEEAVEEIDEIIYRVELPESSKKFMPFKKKKPSLTSEEIMLFKEWAVKGFKE